MGFYTDRILPRVVHVVLGTKEITKLRGPACEGLHGDVIELGFGSGLNLEHLPPGVTGVWAVEPTGAALKLARPRIARSPVDVHVGGLDGARLDFPDARFDAALSTFTLCTIPDVEAALRELRRVLKPGARFHFTEHGLSPDPRVARVQHRFNGLQQKVAGGCHLDRDIAALLTAAGFEIDELRNFSLKGPKAWGYMYSGEARNP